MPFSRSQSQATLLLHYSLWAFPPVFLSRFLSLIRVRLLNDPEHANSPHFAEKKITFNSTVELRHHPDRWAYSQLHLLHRGGTRLRAELLKHISEHLHFLCKHTKGNDNSGGASIIGRASFFSSSNVLSIMYTSQRVKSISARQETPVRWR